MNALDFFKHAGLAIFPAVNSTVRQKHIIYRSICNDDDDNDKNIV